MSPEFFLIWTLVLSTGYSALSLDHLVRSPQYNRRDRHRPDSFMHLFLSNRKCAANKVVNEVCLFSASY